MLNWEGRLSLRDMLLLSALSVTASAAALWGAYALIRLVSSLAPF
jgi:hypothetical protein